MVAFQDPLSMGFSRQEYWSRLSFPSPGDLPDPGIEPGSSSLEADPLQTELWGKPNCFIRFLCLALKIIFESLDYQRLTNLFCTRPLSEYFRLWELWFQWLLFPISFIMFSRILKCKANSFLVCTKSDCRALMQGIIFQSVYLMSLPIHLDSFYMLLLLLLLFLLRNFPFSFFLCLYWSQVGHVLLHSIFSWFESCTSYFYYFSCGPNFLIEI